MAVTIYRSLRTDFDSIVDLTGNTLAQ